MKSIFTILTMSLLVVACGENDSGDNDKSTLGKLSDYGVTFTTQGNNSNTNGSSYYYNASEVLTITCQNVSNRKVTNNLRLQQLEKVQQAAYKNQYIKLNGKRYFSADVQRIVAEAVETLRYAQYSGYNQYNYSGGYNYNTSEPCPAGRYGQGILGAGYAQIVR